MTGLIRFIYPKEFDSELDRKRVSLIVIFCAGMILTMILSAIVTAIVDSSIQVFFVLFITTLFFCRLYLS